MKGIDETNHSSHCQYQWPCQHVTMLAKGETHRFFNSCSKENKKEK